MKVGFLRKKGHVRRNWLDRWFVLTSEGLYYYKNRMVSPAGAVGDSVSHSPAVLSLHVFLMHLYEFTILDEAS